VIKVNENRYEQIRQKLQVYLVTDERDNHDELIHITEEAILGGVTTVQLRCKHTLGRSFTELGRKLRSLTSQYGVLFFVNDRVDVALAVNADGVHVGQDDMHIRDVRHLVGDKWIGVSADTIEHARAAEADGADYIGVGAVYPTKSKLDAAFTGLSGLQDICRQVKMPVVGIGGISLTNAREVFDQGAVGVAVVSAIMQAENPKEAALEFCRIAETAGLPGRRGI
jgi:thiamine-phosphate pyrophosphorylase